MVDVRNISRRWIVVFSAAIMLLLTDGIRFSFGILYIELLEEFKSGKGETAWIGSMLFGISNLAGPLAGYLVQKVDCRGTAVIGSILIATGLALSSVAPNVFVLYATLGLLAGVGISCIILSTLVSVTRHCTTRRSLAMGVTACGGGLGSFIFGPLTHALIQQYGWRGAVLIEAALVLNGVALGALHRPVELEAGLTPASEPCHRDGTGVSAGAAGVHVSDEVGSNDSMSETSLMMSSKAAHSVGMEASPDTEAEVELDIRSENCPKCPVSSTSGPSNRRSTHNSAKLLKVKRWMGAVIPVHVLKHGNIFLYVLSSFIRAFTYFIPPAYLPDLAVEKGMTKGQAAWLTAVLGITLTISRVVIGWIADLSCINRVVMFSACVAGSGLVACFWPFLESFDLLMTLTVIFGVMFAAESCLMVVVGRDLAGSELFADCLSFTMLMCGVGALTGTPLAGWIFDVTGSYMIAFNFAGLVLIASAAIQYIVYLRQVCCSSTTCTRRKEKADSSDNKKTRISKINGQVCKEDNTTIPIADKQVDLDHLEAHELLES